MFRMTRAGDFQRGIFRSQHRAAGVIANSINYWFRHRDYLQVILQRYEAANSAYLEVRRRAYSGGAGYVVDS